MSQTDDIVEVLRDVFGAALVGAYLHGSAASGGLKPRSDVDVLAVTMRSATSAERQVLVDRIMAISGSRSAWGRPVKLTIVVQSEVRPWTYPPRADVQYGEWLRRDFEQGRLPVAELSPDLAPLITMVLAADRPLFGPPPAGVLDPVPPDDLRRAVLAGIPGLLDDLEPDTRNIILTLARIWVTIASGSIRSKDGAADWALARLPEEHRAVLARARAGYLGEAEDDPWDELMPRVQAHVAYVIGEIERSRRRGR